MKPVVRVSILRCPPERFSELRQMAMDADPVLRTGIEAMPGLLTFLLDLGKPFAAKGATFERPIMNYATLWQLKGSAAVLSEGV